MKTGKNRTGWIQRLRGSLPLSTRGRWLCCCTDCNCGEAYLSVYYCWQITETKDQLVKVEKNAWYEWIVLFRIWVIGVFLNKVTRR